MPQGTLEALREAGVDLERLGISTGASLTATQTDRLLERALRSVREPWFGLTLGASVRPELFSALGLSALTAPSLREAFERLARFKPALSGERILLRDEGALTWIELAPSGAHPRTRRMRADAEVAFVVAFARLARPPQRAVEVLLRAAPAYPSRYRRHLGQLPRFRAGRDAVAFSTAQLAAPLISSEHALADLFATRAEETLRELTWPDCTTRTVTLVRELLLRGPVGLEQVAAAQGLTARTLQRRLALEGRTLAQLVDCERQRLAQERLLHTQVGIAELSALLGFSNPNAFHRAFRRWTGLTPLAFRRAAGAPSRRGHRGAAVR